MNEQLLGQFLDYLKHERGSSELTLGTYRADLEEFAKILADEELQLIGSHDDLQILRIYLQILSERQNKHGEAIAKASISRKLSTIRSMLRYLVQQGIFSFNAARLIKTPKISRRLPTVV